MIFSLRIGRVAQAFDLAGITNTEGKKGQYHGQGLPGGWIVGYSEVIVQRGQPR